MDVPLVIRHRLNELGLDQKDLAAAAQVTESYISQLLARKKAPFGELERLVTQKLLDVAKGIARDELDSEKWLRLMARLSKRSYEQMRVTVLEFLDTDIFHVSIDIRVQISCLAGFHTLKTLGIT